MSWSASIRRFASFAPSSSSEAVDRAGKKTAAAIHLEIAREVNRLLARVFRCEVRSRHPYSMPINLHNPFKGRRHPGEVIVLCVRWYLRYPLSYEHVAELLAERGVKVDASCIGAGCRPIHPS